MSIAADASDPSAREDAGTSPNDGGGGAFL